EKLPLAHTLAFALINTTHHTVRRAAVEATNNIARTHLERVSRLGRIGVGAVMLDSAKCQVAKEVNPAVLVNGNNALAPTLATSATPVMRDQAHKLYGALQSLFPTNYAEGKSEDDLAVLEACLMDFAVLFCHPVITAIIGSDAWIRLCVRCGVDPRDLVERKSARWLLKWMESSVLNAAGSTSDDFTLGGLGVLSPEHCRSATLSAISLFTDVSPETTLSALLPKVIESLGNKLVDDLTPVDIEIWKGEEGVLVVDGKKKSAGVVDDRPKNADEKWERELRKELEAKKGAAAVSAAKSAGASKPAAGKPTTAKAAAAAKAEKEAERAQIERESAIRKRVSEIRVRILAALDALEAVVKGVNLSVSDEGREVFEEWISRLNDAVLDGVIARELVVVRNGSEIPKGAVIAGHKAISIYRMMARACDDRIRRFIELGWDIAVLRSMGVEEGNDGLPLELCKKDLSVTVTKMLLSAKAEFTASNPLSPGAFAYIFPLLSNMVHQRGRVRNLKEKIRSELCIYASDMLIAHCSLGGSPFVPSRAMISALIELLTRVPRLHAAAREGLLTLCISMENAEAEGDHDYLDEQTKGAIAEDQKAIVNALYDALLSHEPVAREACLRALQHFPPPENPAGGIAAARVWILREDDIETIEVEAERVWELWNDDATISAESLGHLLELLTVSVADIRTNAGRGLHKALEQHKDKVVVTLENLFTLYQEKNIVPAPEYDKFGIVIPESLEKQDDWPARSGIALALKSCAPVINEQATAEKLFNFLIDQEALGDRNERVRQQMLEAGIAAIHVSGKLLVKHLLKIFSDCLSLPAGASKTHDWIRESVVILLGTVSQHLDPTDKKIPEIAVSECLPALVKLMASEVEDLVGRLLKMLFSSPKYAERRGAAYGLAGVVKGRGIGSLKEYGIMTALKEAIEDKKRIERREGALFAFEALSMALG
ncbi:translational activator of GCN4, partial [Blyttiomyces sp. JEL0837]